MSTASLVRRLVTAGLVMMFVVGFTTSAWSQSQTTWGKNVPTQSQLRPVFEGGATLPLELHQALNKGFKCNFESDRSVCERLWNTASDGQRLAWNVGLMQFLLFAGKELALFTPSEADPSSPEVLVDLDSVEKFGKYWLETQHFSDARLLRKLGTLEKRIAALEGRSSSEIEDIPCAKREGSSKDEKKDDGEGETEKVDITPRKKDAKVAKNGD